MLGMVTLAKAVWRCLVCYASHTGSLVCLVGGGVVAILALALALEPARLHPPICLPRRAFSPFAAAVVQDVASASAPRSHVDSSHTSTNSYNCPITLLLPLLFQFHSSFPVRARASQSERLHEACIVSTGSDSPTRKSVILRAS